MFAGVILFVNPNNWSFISFNAFGISAKPWNPSLIAPMIPFEFFWKSNRPLIMRPKYASIPPLTRFSVLNVSLKKSLILLLHSATFSWKLDISLHMSDKKVPNRVVFSTNAFQIIFNPSIVYCTPITAYSPILTNTFLINSPNFCITDFVPSAASAIPLIPSLIPFCTVVLFNPKMLSIID